VSGNDAWVAWREFALHDVKISATHTAGEDFEEHVTGLRVWDRDILDFERRL
jgi:hypothetical protein